MVRKYQFLGVDLYFMHVIYAEVKYSFLYDMNMYSFSHETLINHNAKKFSKKAH